MITENSTREELSIVPEESVVAECAEARDIELEYASEELRNDPEFMEKIERIWKEKILEELQEEDVVLEVACEKCEEATLAQEVDIKE